MKKKEPKKQPMIFEIDSEELNKGVDNLLNIKTMKDKQEVESWINRLKVAEAAIKNSEGSFNELFKLHRKLGETLLSEMKNPTSLEFRETGNGWRIYNKHKNPNIILTEELNLQAICRNRLWTEPRTHDVYFSSETLAEDINANGLHGATFNNTEYSLVGNINYCGLIVAVETMVNTIPIYVKAFAEYIKRGG